MPDGLPASAGKVSGPARFTRLDAMVPPRGQRRLVALDTFRPTGTWPTVAAALSAFAEARRRGIALVAAAGPETATRVLVSCAWGEPDLEEWLYFSLHVARHTAQVDEIKESPGFPER